MNAGKRSFQQGELGNAVQSFSTATRLSPERVEGWINLGSTLFESKRYEVAAQVLQKALALNPGLMVTHLVLGDTMRMLGKWRAASMSYHRAVALERAPLSLNKLACALRAEGKPELAEGLYREALDMAPGFTLARVNLATLQIELKLYAKAIEQLRDAAQLSLPTVERREVEFAQFAVGEHDRLATSIAELVEHDDPAPLEIAMHHTPACSLKCDAQLVASLQRYADGAQQLATEQVGVGRELPAEWPLIEAMFMIPLVNSVGEYQSIKAELKIAQEPSDALRQSVNMEAAIKAARTCQLDMLDPVKAELHLRHWHALACKNLDGFQPGHFKYTQNWVASHPTVRRVEPALASATFRHFISDIYGKLPAGYVRAAVVYMAMLDLHLFADGNARIGFAWLNRELEWAGLMPAILPNNWGLNGALTEVLNEVRAKGDVSPIIAVLMRAQHYAEQFCTELAEENNNG